MHNCKGIMKYICVFTDEKSTGLLYAMKRAKGTPLALFAVCQQVYGIFTPRFDSRLLWSRAVTVRL